jgi:hypothetical protein
MEPSVLKDHHGPKVVVEGGKTTMLLPPKRGRMIRVEFIVSLWTRISDLGNLEKLPLRANARFSQTASVRGSRHGRPSPLIAR